MEEKRGITKRRMWWFSSDIKTGQAIWERLRDEVKPTGDWGTMRRGMIVSWVDMEISGTEGDRGWEGVGWGGGGGGGALSWFPLSSLSIIMCRGRLDTHAFFRTALFFCFLFCFFFPLLFQFYIRGCRTYISNYRKEREREQRGLAMWLVKK